MKLCNAPIGQTARASLGARLCRHGTMLATSLALVACGKAEKPPETAATPPLSAASTSQPTIVNPAPSDSSASANANGPAHGSTAVGGVSAHGGTGNTDTGQPAPPTAGDGKPASSASQ